MFKTVNEEGKPDIFYSYKEMIMFLKSAPEDTYAFRSVISMYYIYDLDPEWRYLRRGIVYPDTDKVYVQSHIPSDAEKKATNYRIRYKKMVN